MSLRKKINDIIWNEKVGGGFMGLISLGAALKAYDCYNNDKLEWAVGCGLVSVLWGVGSYFIFRYMD